MSSTLRPEAEFDPSPSILVTRSASAMVVEAKRERQVLLDSVNDVVGEGSASGRYLVYDIVGVAIYYTLDNVY